MKNYPDNNSLDEAIEWLNNIEANLDEVGSKSRMGRLRPNGFKKTSKKR